MNMKLTDGSRTYICDGCGQVYKTTDEFNPADSAGGKDFCWKCHPKRMTYRQLIEWLARGNGFLCQQAIEYTTAPMFSLAPVRINDRSYPGSSDDQIPYDEHELVVSKFNDSGICHWEIPTEAMFKADCRKSSTCDEHPLNESIKSTEKLKMQWRIKEYFDKELGGTRYIVQYRQFLFWKSVNLTLFQQATSTASDFNNYDLVGQYNEVAFCRMDDAKQFTYDHEKYLVRGNKSNKPIYHPVTHYRVNLEELTRDL